MRRLSLFVTAVAVLFLLAHDFWAWGEPVPLGPASVPRWIFVFCGLQFALAAVIYWYGRYQDTEDDSAETSSQAP